MTFAGVPFAERGRTVEARVLLAAIHQDREQFGEAPVDTMTADQWHRLFAIAADQRVRPLLHERLHVTGLWRHAPADAWRVFDEDCRGIARRKISLHAELAGILRALKDAGIPSIALKGAFLGPAVYRNVALREMLDLDIMVPRDRLEAAVEIVSARGYAGLHAFNVAADAAVRNHVTDLIKPGVAVVELHWNICVPGQATSIDATTLWERAQPVTLPGVTTLALSPEDLLLHLCFHASFHHEFEFGLRPFCDIARVIGDEAMAINWAEVVGASERRHWARGVGLSLRLAANLVGAGVPAEVHAAFASHVGTRAAEAEPLVWTTPDESAAFTRNMASLGAASWPERVRRAARHIFVPRAELTAMYATAPNGLWWRLLYARRLVDVVSRNLGTAVRLLKGRQGPLSDLAQRRHAMREWLTPSA